MNQQFILIAVDENGKAMGNWDGRFVTKNKLEFVSDHDARIELANYRPRFLHRYPENWKVLKATVNFNWDAMTVENRSRNNPLRKRKKMTVGQPG